MAPGGTLCGQNHTEPTPPAMPVLHVALDWTQVELHVLGPEEQFVWVL
jgi:hypothetical protein